MIIKAGSASGEAEALAGGALTGHKVHVQLGDLPLAQAQQPVACMRLPQLLPPHQRLAASIEHPRLVSGGLPFPLGCKGW